MASKHAPLETHDLSGPAQPPPSISLSDKLLCSAIPLPDRPCIVYSVYHPMPSGASCSHESLELARRKLLDRNRSRPLLDSWLPSVLVKGQSTLYAYSIVSQDHFEQCQSDMCGLLLDGLHLSEASCFTPKDIYPCSLSCSTQRVPCQTCLEQQSQSQSQTHTTPTASSSRLMSSSLPTPASSAVCLLPRRPLRRIFSQFLEALRDRLINDISDLFGNKTKTVMRFKDGFLLGQFPIVSEYQQQLSTRPFMYCHLDILFTSSRIIIHPILRFTQFLPLYRSLPPIPGAPIILAPYAVPAYFLSTYNGPTSALTTQFEGHFSGLGVGEWNVASPLGTLSHSGDELDHVLANDAFTPYVIVWVSVENKQGEDKGMTVIWPARLCVAFLTSSTSVHARMPLSYLPQLPQQLQFSPKLLSTSSHALKPDRKITSSTLTSSSPIKLWTCRTPTSDSLRAFRLLTLSRSKDINQVAAEVGGYVDAVAKEREKERERIRREREMVNASASPRTVGTSGTPLPGPSLSVVTPGTTPGAARSEPIDGQNTAAPMMPLPPTQVQGPITPIQQYPTQHFYPSPPLSNLPNLDAVDGMQTSPEVLVAPLPEAQSVAIQSPLPADALPTSSSTTTFDPFTNLGTATWSQQSTSDFLGMNVDFGMGGFDLGMDPIAGSSGEGGGNAGGIYDRGGMEPEDAFTDDDFSFFDRPSRTTPANTTIPLSNSHMNSNLVGVTDTVPLTFPSPLFGSGGPGPSAFATTQSNLLSPWAPAPLGDAFTPKFTEAEVSHADPFPLSPSQTPWSRSAPSSPIVQLSYEQNRSDNRRPSSSRGLSVFDPIPFAPSHRLSDGKYAIGKFALPSPPDEEDRTQAISTVSLSPPRRGGWKSRYSAATDPRVGVVRNLKRKSLDQGVREKVKRFWRSEHDDFPPKVEGDKFEVESDEEIEENDSHMVSRPSTPPPAYLSLGSTLLRAQFQHCHLLPLTMPLRPPGAAVAPTNITSPPAANSVPTPVSPAAIIGAASEKSKSLEAAAQAVAREVVENSVWADAWRANITGSSSALKQSWDIWQADIMVVKQLLEGVPGLENALDLAALFEPDASVQDGDLDKPMRSMDSPMISVAKADAIIQVLPTALRFWEKLGLGPRGGKKDVTAFVLFEGDDFERQQQAERWLGNMSAAYTGKRFGRHNVGSCSAAIRAGLVPLRFDAFRKNILNFVANLTNLEGHLVFYVITPTNTMTLASPLFRQFLSAVKRAVKSCPSLPLFQFVPEYIVFGSLEDPATYNSHLETICFSVYDRILRPVDRVTSRSFFENGEKIQNHIQDPSLALARPVHSKVQFLWQAPARSLDVVDRHTLLHVGYSVTPCGKWILAACIDERGEAHDIDVWLTQSEAIETHIVSEVWSFALRFARKANLEWRIAIAKLGSMKESELKAWMLHLGNRVPAGQELSLLHVSLFSVDPDASWIFTTSHNLKRPANARRTSPRDKLGFIIVDSSASIYALFSKSRIPLSCALSSQCSRYLNAELCFVPEADDEAEQEEPGILPLSTSTLVRVPSQPGPTSISMLQIHLLHTIKTLHASLTIPDSDTHADVTKNYHDLALLTRYRWRMEANPILPFHLAALEVMRIALDRGDSVVD